MDTEHIWNPRLYVENTIGEPKESIYRNAIWNEKGEAYMTEKRRVKGVFLENLELGDFPFDVQVSYVYTRSGLVRGIRRSSASQRPACDGTTVLQPPSGLRPGRRQARHAHILQIGLYLCKSCICSVLYRYDPPYRHHMP